MTSLVEVKMKYKFIGITLFVGLILIIIGIKPIGRCFYPLKYNGFITKYSKAYSLDPYMVAALIKAESNFNNNAKSQKNAYGLMQITDETGKWAAGQMKISNFNSDLLYDPEFNIKMGCWYLNNLKAEFNGNMDVVLAAYNGGRGNVQKWLSNKDHSSDGKNLYYIPFKETDKYVKRVNTNYKVYKFLYVNIKN